MQTPYIFQFISRPAEAAPCCIYRFDTAGFYLCRVMVRWSLSQYPVI